MQTTELPIELDCFLMNLGFFEKDQLPDFRPYRFKHKREQMMFVCTTPERRRNSSAHAPVYIPEQKPKHIPWKPSYKGEEPPF